ncbi:hypothetical protein [Nitratidesulfovibrio termitidis]|uniref:hypothetical protein n=1 Tax=Nitratidesulfovibrio termitidis TaxID=42252 RepID=UPI000409247F|nr:hypothetical protein [Nitratidesulfovibrio termitidis]
MSFEIKEFAKSFSVFEAGVKAQVGNDAYNKRISDIIEYLLGSSAVFRECNDRLFLYLVFGRALIEENYIFYNLFEGARVIPMLFKLSSNWNSIESIANFEAKLEDLCRVTNRDVDAVIFELLVASAYKNSGYTVSFIPEAPPDRTPDIMIEKDGVTRYVECKKMQRGSDYSYKEMDRWYDIADIVRDIILESKISAHFHFKFKSELLDINPKRIIRKIRKKIETCKNISTQFHITKNEDFTIKFKPIDKSKFNTELDPMRNFGGPSFAEYLTGSYKNEYGYKIIGDVKIEEPPFVSIVNHASVMSHQFVGSRAAYKKAVHAKRKLIDASGQLTSTMPGNIHILVEDCQGLTVHESRAMRNIIEISNFTDTNGGVENIHLHVCKYVTPLNELFDVEETVISFHAPNCVPQVIPPVWFHTEQIEEGFGTLLQEH